MRTIENRFESKSHMSIKLSLILALGLVHPALAQSPVRDISNRPVDAHHLENAIASRTLTWLTGSSANNDYISVGRMANFFGFVALRVSSGQSVTRSNVANDALTVLTAEQRETLIALLEEQKPAYQMTQSARFALNRALEGMLVGDSIERDAFVAMGRAYGAAEAELGRVIAQRLGEVAQTLTRQQQTAFDEIRTAHAAGQGHLVARERVRLRLSQEDKQELVNIAARLISWTTGTEAFNDFEVVGKPSQHFGFVSLRIASNHGVQRGAVAKEVLALLTPQQRSEIESAAAHDARAFVEFLAARAELMRTLETALQGNIIDAKRVATLGAKVGEIEASMTLSQANAMLAIRDTLTQEQSSALLSMRAAYTDEAQRPDDPIERGRQIFAQCALCHSDNRAVAPTLSNIVGRPIATDPDFQHYSSALTTFGAAEGAWSETNLDRFLASPRSLVPGTGMGFDGLRSAQDRAALIAYLRTLEGPTEP